MRCPALAFLLMIALASNASAIFWASSVDTNSSHWQIYRHSDNISFKLSGSVEGLISPVKLNGRVLPSYQSCYSEVGLNDLQYGERISALEGKYSSDDNLELDSNTDGNKIDISISKPRGTDIFTITYNNEQWPIIIRSGRTIDYSGKQINDRSFEGNNGDFISADFLYNHEFSAAQRTVMWAQRLNATVLGTNESILLAEVEATKYSGYVVMAQTDGIADLSYMQRSPQYDTKHNIYPAVNEGDERYYGKYNLNRRIEMRSIFENPDIDDDWLSCCVGGWRNMTSYDLNGFGAYGGNIFDCKCYSPASKI